MVDVTRDLQACKTDIRIKVFDTGMSVQQGENVREYLERSAEDLMKFAEILYKCSLCTTLPSILTSQSSFLSHIYNQHLNEKTSGKKCAKCGLKFGTVEDLKSHTIRTHAEISTMMDGGVEENNVDIRVSCSNSPMSDEMSDKVTSQEIRCRNETFGKSKDHEHGEIGCKEKQATNSTIRTVQSNKQSEADKKKSNPYLDKHGHVISTSYGLYNGWGKLPPPPVPGSDSNLQSQQKRTTSESLSQLQRLTDQILVSNSSPHKGPPGSFVSGILGNISPMAQSPGFTQEFGKYTKLVREGGNIVYFCQACNWKCPSKPGFYNHCLGKSHKAKLNILAKPDSYGLEEGSSKMKQDVEQKSEAKTTKPKTEDSNLAKSFRLEESLPRDLLDLAPKRSSGDISEVRSDKEHTSISSPQTFQNSSEEKNIVPPSENSKSLVSRKLQSDVPEENLSTGIDSKHFFDAHDGSEELTQRINCDHILASPNMKNQDLEQDSVSRHRRKRPAPMMIRYQPDDRSGDWSDSCSSANSEDDQRKLPLIPDTPEKKVIVTSLNKRRIIDHSSDAQFHGSQISDSRVREPETSTGTDSLLPLATNTNTDDNCDALSETPVSIYNRISQNIAENLTKMVDKESSLICPLRPIATVRIPSNHDEQSRDIPKNLSDNQQTQVKQEVKHPESTYPDSNVGVFRCGLCDFTYQEFRHYRQHYEDEHEGDNSENVDGEGSKSGHGESWKILKIKDVLPELLCVCSKGNVARDLLLQKACLVLSNPDIVHWGPACNKAVREEFPSTIAQRKGKFKNYFFGVAFIEQIHEPEDVTDPDGFSFQPLRDMSLDTDKILRLLPELIYWTGDLEYGVSRDELLHLLDERMEESNVSQWGIECNRAVRRLFPEIHTKRKGKYKTYPFHADLFY